MPRLVPLVAITALLLSGGCTEYKRSSTAVVPAAPSPTPPSAVASADNPPGARTCSRLGAAVQRGTLMDPGVVDGIVAASSTADAPVADSAQRLATAYAAAAAAKGDDQADAIAAVSAAAADMSGVCNDSGLETVG